MWLRKIQLYDALRFGRLCAWLRQREPGDRIGGSLLVYELSDDDVRAALFGPPAELRQNYSVKGTRDLPDQQLEFLR